jgi:acetylornithine deacetylase/succinyl-diaminopimelate desuccinylase-like protein
MRAWVLPGARLLLGLAIVGGALRATAAEIDWSEVEKEATEFLGAYIRIDTANPPGNETAAAQFLARQFEKEGIQAEVFESAPGRGSVLARLAGTGGAQSVILLSHLDVVPATPDGWDLPPFSGAVRDGYVYGRGAFDCKGPGTIAALAMLLLKRQGQPLKRDVIFLGTADEETGGRRGAGWMVQHHLDKLRGAGFVLNEGGGIHILPDGKRVYEVAVSEKTPCWLRLTTRGEGGHGSAPPQQTAVTRLVRALDRLRHYRPQIRVVPDVAAYYAALAALQDDARRTRYQNLGRALRDPTFRTAFLRNPSDAALVHNTITPTVLIGSQKINVIPPSAVAELDCRLLPGEDPGAFVRTIKTVINDPEVAVETVLTFPASSSPPGTALFAALRVLAGREGVPMLPSVLTGFTDSHYFREQGIASYGFVPFALDDEELRREHGVNERIATANLREGTRRLFELLRMLDHQEAEPGRRAEG